MTQNPTSEVSNDNRSGHDRGFTFRPSGIQLAAIWVVALMMITGCQTQGPQSYAFTPQAADRSQPIELREGDVLKISFPGAPNLNTTQQIRRDGRIALPLVGEIKAAEMTPASLKEEILKLYADQLVSKEVTVEVQSSTFPVFVTGAVVRPGKITSDHPITALEAIMEAGGFNFATANLKAVGVIRQESGQVKKITLNLKLVMEGKQPEPFYLKPADVVYVPERFQWF